MPPPTPEPRFEVPPEYAEVYERAYRRAYEEGQGQLGSGEETDAARPARGRRGSRLWEPARARSVEPATLVEPDDLRPVRERHSHRAGRRAGWPSSAPGLVLVAVVLLASSFVLGRLSAGESDVPGAAAGSPAGTSVSVVPVPPVRAVETGLAGLHAALEPPGPYRGPVSRLGGARAEATCAAPAVRDTRGQRVDYAPRNVLDGVASTAWLCKGSAVGQRLTITLATASDVVGVGILPGYARTDRYAQNNRVTRVAWTFDDGTRVVQTLSASRTDRSLRTLRLEPVRTRTVVLEILAVARGAKDNTAISAMRLDTYAR